MKKIKILTVVLLAIGLASAGIGCGSSSGSSSGSGGGNVKGSINTLPTANLTVSNVGSAASGAISAADKQPPSNASSVANGAASSGAQIPTLSYLFNHLGKTIVVKPQSMTGSALKGLSAIKQAVLTPSASQYCSPTTVDNSTTGAVDVTYTWSNATCTFSTTSVTMNGSVAIKGSYDSTAGTVSITDSMDLKANISDTSSGLTETFSISGSETIDGSGIVSGSTSVTFTDKGTINFSGSVTANGNSGSFTGWITVNEEFTGTPSQLTFVINDGNEMDSGSTKIGEYSSADITMTIAGSPATVTVNGSGAFGVTANSGTYSFSGKVSILYSGVTFDNTCYAPVAGTITITADHVFVLDFTGQACGHASVTEDGTSKGTIVIP